MTRVIESRVHDHEAAQDILHDGFIIALSSIASLNKPDKFESWLTTIMKNLSLQYLREATNHISSPMTDTSDENAVEDDMGESDLSWDELNNIIDRLPDGYNKVFRLAVLDGLSHKEIGKLLGIAPHSSSSQLFHAKAMLRRLITEYRIGIGVIGVFSIILTAILIWLGIDRIYEKADKNPIAGESGKSTKTEEKTRLREDNIVASTDSIAPSAKIKRKTILESKENIAETVQPQDSTIILSDDSLTDDTISKYPYIPPIGHPELLSDNATATIRRAKKEDWSIALSYNGNLSNRYKTQGTPDISTDLPDGEIETVEQTKHYMPLVIGLSLRKSLSNRWSIESGIRYSFLRSEFLHESTVETTEIDQRIHYLGVPLKFSYRILGNAKFSLYGQGGITLDIPIRGTQTIMKWKHDWNKPLFDNLNRSAPLQWSVEGGVGFQYHITPSFSIYAEPSFRFYINPGSEIKTLRHDKPSEFAIPIGIRFNW